MSIEIGNRLAALRKAAGYSQEDVAEKLGVSRQAVSRWENGEASPDTENLIALSDLYQISLDDLVRGKGDGFVPEDAQEEGENEERRYGPLTRADAITSSVLTLVCLAAYLVVGFTWKTENGSPVGWASMWILLLAPGLIESIINAFRHGKMSLFAIPILVVMVYVGMGIIGNFYGQNFWHPYWIEFFAIPLYYSIARVVDRYSAKANEKH